MVTQRALSIKAGVNEATTRTAIDRMEAELLVNRINDPTDRRKRFIRLTDRARALEPALISFADDLNKQILEALPPDDRREFLVKLAKVHNHITIMAADARAVGVDKLA